MKFAVKVVAIPFAVVVFFSSFSFADPELLDVVHIAKTTDLKMVQEILRMANPRMDFQKDFIGAKTLSNYDVNGSQDTSLPHIQTSRNTLPQHYRSPDDFLAVFPDAIAFDSVEVPVYIKFATGHGYIGRATKTGHDIHIRYFDGSANRVNMLNYSMVLAITEFRQSVEDIVARIRGRSGNPSCADDLIRLK